ncbi:DUF1566 domain-containing protein [Thioflexithrix psekupsensis]|uniref:Lcl C-terminal domain-containing protein n=1 Tax=Thioflexithrix psekupsensis TaxID=1570016 RepID=A0A251X903_9GAMM|nr:DUF1566 domain-containing protein [Thioflexithrix psekupsensis]OUD14415.1 hypothetical protein TPSD3_08890 [Thioflexithrix psekupsensis]
MTEDQIQDFARLEKSYQAVFDNNARPEHRSMDCRKFAEAICRRLYVQEMRKQPDKLMTLKSYLDFFRNKQLPLAYIYPQIETIQNLGNYAGHDQHEEEPITLGYIQPALSAVDVLMNWYVKKKLQRNDWLFVQGVKKEENLAKPVQENKPAPALELPNIKPPESKADNKAVSSTLIKDRYRDNGDGTITDIKTNLQWMRCLIGQEWQDGRCQGEAQEMNWHNAQKLKINFAGYNDWRVATIEELLSQQFSI